jgi:alpha-tubulin suppressor-like RCC1 family protein
MKSVTSSYSTKLRAHKEYKPELYKYLNNKQIIDIFCGRYHSLVLTNSGEVHTWGRYEDGQIGIGRSCENERQLTQIKLNGFNDENVAIISCGSIHSMALTESGRVFIGGKINLDNWVTIILKIQINLQFFS